MGNPHPLWQRFFEACDRDGYQYEIVIHTAKPLSDYYEPFRLAEHKQTSWERTIQAHKPLIAFAASKGCDKAILISETCIPTATPQTLWVTLAKMVGKTVLNGVHPLTLEDNKAWHKYPILNAGAALWKCEQWCFIDQVHYELYKESQIAAAFANSVADNEGYLIALLRENDQSHNAIAVKQNGQIEQLHLSVWHNGQAHPIQFVTKEREAIEKAKNGNFWKQYQRFTQESFDARIKRGCLFMRKFDHDVMPVVKY